MHMWEKDESVQEVLRYVHEFRVAHDVDLSRPRPFHTDDLGEIGQFVLGELMNVQEFEGPWTKLSDLAFASRVAQGVRSLRFRLNAYIARKGTVTQEV